MSEYLRDSSPEFHRDLIALFFSKNNEYTAAPRGFSKTTIIQVCISFSVVNELDTFIVLVEKSFTEASEVLAGVRDVLVNNKKIRLVYGKLMYQEEDSEKDPDAKGDMLINGVRLRAKGFNTTIRGLKSKAYRPSRVILDDVETDEHIDNPEQRKKYMENYNKGIQPAVDIEGVCKVFGTILHFDSLLMNLIKWHMGRIYRAYNPDDPKNTLLWPSRWTFERLEAKKAQMMTDKGSNAFTQEYLNDPISEDARVFKYEWLWRQDRQVKFSDIKNKTFNGYAALDVADSTKEGSDWTGAVVHLVDNEGNHYRVSCKRERRNVLGKIDLIFEIWSKWRPYGLNEIGVEKKAFEDEIRPLLEVEKVRRQIYPIVSELKPMHTSKRSRIKGNLEGRYQTGKIWTIIDETGVPIENTEDLFNELYNFPAAKNDDLGDAEAYLIDMAEIPLKETRATKNSEPDDDPFENSNTGVQDDPF